MRTDYKGVCAFVRADVGLGECTDLLIFESKALIFLKMLRICVII